MLLFSYPVIFSADDDLLLVFPGAGESFDAGSVDKLSNWLSSTDLHSAIHSSMHDLVTATDRIKERG